LPEAVPEVPEWERQRPKNEWRGMFSFAEMHAPIPVNTWYHHWSVMAFQGWLAQATAKLAA